MNNSSKVEAYRSFYEQGKVAYSAGAIQDARDLFLKAAELANEISINSTTYDVRMEYHRLTIKILHFVKTNCATTEVVNTPKTEQHQKEETPVIKPETKNDTVTFDDVAGLEEVKDQIRYKILAPLSNPGLAEFYRISAGGKILLYGPPGTGKTYVARAIAGEVDAKFYAVNCQDLISKYMGESSKKLDALFEEAQTNEKAIIFFDEFDSLASKRDDGSSGVDAEMARFVATFLTKVDGFQKSQTNKMLLLIAATNRPWVIDNAMLRGGRFDTQIYVGVPDQNARLFMVNKTLGKLPMDDDVDLSKLAKAVAGFGGGDVIAICERIKLEAYMRAVKTGLKQNISREDCNKVLTSTRNVIDEVEIAKFEMYRAGRTVD